MKAIVSVIGRDKVGIIAKVSTELASLGINILDISQTILGEYFTMMMMVSVKEAGDIASVSARLAELGKDIGVQITIQHESIFNAMHKL